MPAQVEEVIVDADTSHAQHPGEQLLLWCPGRPTGAGRAEFGDWPS